MAVAGIGNGIAVDADHLFAAGMIHRMKLQAKAVDMLIPIQRQLDEHSPGCNPHGNLLIRKG
ncbi:hypothetical protein D3C81_2144900 [compost metagenome]